MATPAELKNLSTPKVFVDGVVVAIVPNSFKLELPGETKVRAMNAGGGAVQMVVGVDAESDKADIEFKLAGTANNIERIRGWRAKARRGQPSAIRVVEETAQYSFEQMFMTDRSDVEFSAEGDASVKFCGKMVE